MLAADLLDFPGRVPEQALARRARQAKPATFDAKGGCGCALEAPTAPHLDLQRQRVDRELERGAGRARPVRVEGHALRVARHERDRASAGSRELAHQNFRTRRIATCASRSASRFLMVWRLSCCFLPRATAISILARLFLK